MTTSRAYAPSPAPMRRALLHRWPAALGLVAAAAALLVGPDRETVATAVCVAALCYLAAAAFGRPWVAWAAIIPAGLVVFLSELAGVTWWVGMGVAAFVLVVVGLLRRTPGQPLGAQVVALLAYGGIAVAALFLGPRVGLVVAGVVLAAHALWDVLHYRLRQVVGRDLAEFCMALDLPLGLGAIVLAAVAW